MPLERHLARPSAIPAMLATLLSVSAVVVTSPSSPVKGRHTLCPVPSGLLSRVIGRHYRTPANRAHTGLPTDQIARNLRAQQLLTRASQQSALATTSRAQSALATTSRAQSAHTYLPIIGSNPRHWPIRLPNYVTCSNHTHLAACHSRDTIDNPYIGRTLYLAEYCHTHHNTKRLPL